MRQSSTLNTELLTPDDPRWLQELGKAKHDIFHMPGYLRAWTAAKGGEPLLYSFDAGAYGMLVPMIRRSLGSFGARYKGFHDAVSPYGYSGPIYWGDCRPERLEEMNRQFAIHLREANFVSVFLRLHPFLGASDDMLAALGSFGDLRHQGPVVYMDLRDPEGSWIGINPGNRRAIKRALRVGCAVTFDRWETLDQVVTAYEETMLRHEAADDYFLPPEFFLQLRRSTHPHFHLATSYDGQGSVTGGVFFSEIGGLIQYFLTGTFSAFAALSPGKLLVNALRLWGLERHCHTLNLGGGLGAREDSLFTFKIRLSKSTAAFHTLSKIILPDIYRELDGGVEHDASFFPGYRRPANAS